MGWPGASACSGRSVRAGCWVICAAGRTVGLCAEAQGPAEWWAPLCPCSGTPGPGGGQEGCRAAVSHVAAEPAGVAATPPFGGPGAPCPPWVPGLGP